MILRFIKFAWLISVVAGLASLLYTYAASSDQIVYSLSDKYIEKGAISRDSFFYLSLLFLAGTNFLLYALSKNVRYKKASINDLLRKWQISLGVVLNIFFIIVINFIQLINSGEKVNYDHFGYLLYIAFGLIVIWILALPILMVQVMKSEK